MLFESNLNNQFMLTESAEFEHKVHQATRINLPRIVDVYLGAGTTCIKYHHVEVSYLSVLAVLCVTIVVHEGQPRRAQDEDGRQQHPTICRKHHQDAERAWKR